jgi:hypothetical protein
MNAQWGTFTKPHAWGTCLSFAQDSFRKHGYEVFGQGDGDYMIVGRNGNVIVQVTSVPQSGNSWVCVSAFSPDAGAAGQARDTIRTDIVRSQTID